MNAIAKPPTQSRLSRTLTNVKAEVPAKAKRAESGCRGR